MIQAEDELDYLPHMEDPGADGDADPRELPRTNWSVAVLELVFLYRLHLEVQGQTHLRTFAGLLGIAQAARLSDNSVVRRVHASLEARQQVQGEAVHYPIINGSLADCADTHGVSSLAL